MKDLTEQDKNEYLQWLKNTGRSVYKLTDVYVMENEKVGIEKKMAWISKISPSDWYEFCKKTGRECEGFVNLLAIY